MFLTPLHFSCFNRRKEKPFESTVTTAWGWNNTAASTVFSIFLCRIKVTIVNVKCIIQTESNAWGTHQCSTLTLYMCGSSSHKPIMAISSMGKSDCKPSLHINSLHWQNCMMGKRNERQDLKQMIESMFQLQTRMESRTWKSKKMHAEWII